VRYDLKLIHELCQELGFNSHQSGERLELELSEGILCFQNAERDEDCLIGFESTPWHYHDDLMVADGRGFYLELSYLDIVTGLKDGSVLICELWREGQLCDRWLIHRDYNDEFKYMENTEEIRIHRALPTGTL
jgi:hypothetical protein